jgi:hypothetical protein
MNLLEDGPVLCRDERLVRLGHRLLVGAVTGSSPSSGTTAI